MTESAVKKHKLTVEKQVYLHGRILYGLLIALALLFCQSRESYFDKNLCRFYLENTSVETAKQVADFFEQIEFVPKQSQKQVVKKNNSSVLPSSGLKPLWQIYLHTSGDTLVIDIPIEKRVGETSKAQEFIKKLAVNLPSKLKASSVRAGTGVEVMVRLIDEKKLVYRNVKSVDLL